MTAPTTRTRPAEATVEPDPIHSTQFVHAWAAPSRTHANVTYTVRYDRLENAWSCMCPAYTYRGHCSHIEASMADQVERWRERMTGVRSLNAKQEAPR